MEVSHKNGQVRSATVRTSSNIYERPAVKLAVLDIGATESTQEPGPYVLAGTVPLLPDAPLLPTTTQKDSPTLIQGNADNSCQMLERNREAKQKN